MKGDILKDIFRGYDYLRGVVDEMDVVGEYFEANVSVPVKNIERAKKIIGSGLPADLLVLIPNTYLSIKVEFRLCDEPGTSLNIVLDRTD